MTDMIKQYAERIAGMIKDTESIQNDRYMTDYQKKMAKITTYDEIVELVKGASSDGH